MVGFGVGVRVGVGVAVGRTVGVGVGERVGVTDGFGVSEGTTVRVTSLAVLRYPVLEALAAMMQDICVEDFWGVKTVV